jgi:SAM-dependent methyltransferase
MYRMDPEKSLILTDHVAVREWVRIPVDDVGYVSSAELLQLDDVALRNVIDTLEVTRYTGWRNHEGLWRSALKLDVTRDAHVLDYGCGIGVEALQYAKAGNEVWLADIVESNVRLAERVLRLYGYEPAGSTVMPESYSSRLPKDVDVVHCAGVLHHIRQPIPTMQRFAGLLQSLGEVRLMVYSDEGWRLYTGTEPPHDVTDDPMRETFLRAFDEVGMWADWYDEARLVERFGEWFDVESVTYLTPNRRYLAATLRMKR